MVRRDGANDRTPAHTHSSTANSSRNSLARGIAVARIFTAGWTIAALGIGRHDITHPAVAIGATVLALAATIFAAITAIRNPSRLTSATSMVVDVAIGVALMLADGWAFIAGHVFGRGQSLTASWPLVAALSCGFLGGLPAGAGAGLFLGGGRIVGGFANARWHNVGIDWADIGAGTALYTVAGAVGGWVAVLLGRAEIALLESQAEQASLAARHEVARTLHDTVLQTLAVVAHRSDPDVAALARRTDRELRHYLFNSPTSSLDLAALLRTVAAEVGDRFGRAINASIAGELGISSQSVVDAIVGASREALTNACKHAAATTITLFAERSDDSALFVSIRDDGIGFSGHAIGTGFGISRSIESRLHEIGGRVQIESSPGHGTDVQLFAA